MIIKIEPFSNGSHANQSMTPKNIPDGWAVIPDDMELPNFPFGTVTSKEIDGVMTVTTWVAGTMPEPEPIPEPEPTADELLDALLGVTSYE